MEKYDITIIGLCFGDNGIQGSGRGYRTDAAWASRIFRNL
jgi:hypothetical protein